MAREAVKLTIFFGTKSLEGKANCYTFPLFLQFFVKPILVEQKNKKIVILNKIWCLSEEAKKQKKHKK